MFTNTAFSPQPLPSCHLVLHSDICLNPLSPTETYPPCLQTQLFLLNPSPFPPDTVEYIRILSAQVYKHSFFFPPVVLSCRVVYVFILSAKFTKDLFFNHWPPVILSSTVVHVQIPSAQANYWALISTTCLLTSFLAQYCSIGSNPLRYSCRGHCAYTVFILEQRLGHEMANFLFFRLNFGHD